MRVLITGGKGDIAQAIAKELSKDIYYYEILTPNKDEMDVGYWQLVKFYMDEHKPNILINCAGHIKPGQISDLDIHEWEKHIQINLLGTYYCSKFALENKCKTIINIASTSGLEGRAGWSAYCASKAGVISLTQSLAEEGVKAYCLSPGRTKSKMRKKLFPNEDQLKLLNPNAIGELVADILSEKYQNGSHIVISKKDGIKIQD